jgi:hypothetical protein
MDGATMLIANPHHGTHQSKPIVMVNSVPDGPHMGRLPVPPDFFIGRLNPPTLLLMGLF